MRKVHIFLPTILTGSLLLSSCGSTVPSPSNSEVAYKPVIYLYGYEGNDVTVNLDIDGNLGLTYPQSPSGKWSFRVGEDGLLDFNGHEYRYLFWDGDLNTEFTFNRGYCVSGTSTKTFLEDKLDSFSFTDQEKQDFITYWIPYMSKNPYNVISFQTKAYTDAAKLTVTPKPDRLIRIFMAWYPSDTMIDIPAQNLKVPKRTGKTVLEWGGSEVEPPANTTPLPVSGAESSAAPSSPAPAADPYAAYGAMAQCAKDWDSSNISGISGKWSTLSTQMKGEAYYHWQHYGKSGW